MGVCPQMRWGYSLTFTAKQSFQVRIDILILLHRFGGWKLQSGIGNHRSSPAEVLRTLELDKAKGSPEGLCPVERTTDKAGHVPSRPASSPLEPFSLFQKDIGIYNYQDCARLSPLSRPIAGPDL